jgi:RNA polymerase sigma factor (sigma-70 family)
VKFPNKIRQLPSERPLETRGTRISGAAGVRAFQRMPHFQDPRDADLGRLPDKLRRFFLSRGVRTEDDARDLSQETLLRVFQRMTRGEVLESLVAYSLGVAKNVFLEYCRRIARTSLLDGISGAVQIAGSEDPLSDALVSSRALRFRRALDLLPARMKVLLVRRFVEEVPSRAIAREEGICTDAVDMRVYRAKRELRKRMDADGSAKPRATRDDGDTAP